MDFSAVTDSLISALDSCRGTEAPLLTADSVSRAQSRGRLRGSAFSGARGSLCWLLPEKEAHILNPVLIWPLLAVGEGQRLCVAFRNLGFVLFACCMPVSGSFVCEWFQCACKLFLFLILTLICLFNFLFHWCKDRRYLTKEPPPPPEKNQALFD